MLNASRVVVEDVLLFIYRQKIEAIDTIDRQRDRLQADPELRAAHQTRPRSFKNRAFYLDRMIESTNTLRALLQQAGN
jgi:hypothetical protein